MKKLIKKWNLWVREQCTDALFTKDWSKVAATVHVQYMNSNRLWGKPRAKKKKKKKGETTETKRSKRNTVSKLSLILSYFYPTYFSSRIILSIQLITYSILQITDLCDYECWSTFYQYGLPYFANYLQSH